MLFRRFCSRGFFVFFGAGLYGVVWFSFHLWTVSVPLKLCSVPDIQLVVAVRRESAHSGRMRLGGDVAWSMTTLHDPAGIQANR